MGGNNSNSIPKKARPQSVNDYRKISICNAGYRIYATYLLKLLDEEIETMGNYQAAFMRYRSTDDHIFVVRRILDENGRQNHVLSQRTYVNPMVWTKKPKVSPKEKGSNKDVHSHLGFFTIVLDDVLRTLEELVSEVRLDQDAEINLPVILSFADDIIIIGDSTTVLTNIMKNLKELLISVGLKLNETKTKMLVRDPINKSIAKQTQEINGVLITPVDTIKYLGTYLTSELSRRDTIKARCKQAIRNAKGLIPFIKKTKMHWKIAKLIYKMVISPSMTYGLNVVALTKSNRTRLRQYEREILKDMLQAARNQPKLKTQEILEGKTITKIIKVRRICYYGHLLRRDQPHILNSALRYTTTERKVGRPIYTWEDSLRQDLNYHNRNQEEWDTLAQNKMEMKKAADELYQLPETDTESSAPSEENEE
ncbi:Putative uncharacterized transposon-derived protein F52C9.6 [Eumeta japonica]|uniref:Uncharacterized transposon-derived protein F52C9.6 n=1 Tax=Eumeta variegata TaxID=151549 RepID=A0A4C1T3U6_EUMVA|nr:Putative uncharacterized transposon-derived protein F52C9.6 [Eumeta japonica]